MPEGVTIETESRSVQSPAPLRGRIFDIQRFSVHDGPGIRTTVFLKGCPLRCLWCHNPEGISSSSEVSFLPEKCAECGECALACNEGAHRFDRRDPSGREVTHEYDRAACKRCGRCTEFCDMGALELVGRAVTVDEVMKEVALDRTFYLRTGGGMTISGGEPLAQIDFTVALLHAARHQGIHRCVETSGFASWERFRPLLPLVDLFLFDCKETDPEKHKAFTGQSNAIILRNLRELHATGMNIQLQCPVIPGCNDREDHFAAIADLARSLPNLQGVRLLPYHPLGESKLRRFGLRAASDLERQPLDPAQLDHWDNWLRGQGVPVLNAQCAPRSDPSP